MGKIADLLRELTPAWMAPVPQADPGTDGWTPPALPPGDPDEAWRSCHDRGLFGAATPDYTLEERSSAARSPMSDPDGRGTD